MGNRKSGRETHESRCCDVKYSYMAECDVVWCKSIYKKFNGSPYSAARATTRTRNSFLPSVIFPFCFPAFVRLVGSYSITCNMSRKFNKIFLSLSPTRSLDAYYYSQITVFSPSTVTYYVRQRHVGQFSILHLYLDGIARITCIHFVHVRESVFVRGGVVIPIVPFHSSYRHMCAAV